MWCFAGRERRFWTSRVAAGSACRAGNYSASPCDLAMAMWLLHHTIGSLLSRIIPGLCVVKQFGDSQASSRGARCLSSTAFRSTPSFPPARMSNGSSQSPPIIVQDPPRRTQGMVTVWPQHDLTLCPASRIGVRFPPSPSFIAHRFVPTPGYIGQGKATHSLRSTASLNCGQGAGRHLPIQPGDQ